MRTILALGILVALTASASAGTVQHRRHAAPAAQNFAPKLTPRAAEGYAYVPYAAPYSAPAGYGNPYQNWGG
ncbi:hypothetical protein [Bradyrhizobium liaoningense]|uniref:hypothetical protein n=1 Tax=Bradyrhizobium liaoningense TaxID=43992 RepID=UPI001BAD5717|nr:hypothetical protein [Bradyrhizobium liaoningense]MBR0712581.1 hypothetical protein [Bradyrhizobium liaoningense]